MNKESLYLPKIRIMKIKSVEIKNLWRQGRILWEFKDNVNILVGNNGSGKSTILKLIKTALLPELSEEDKKIFALIDDMILHLESENKEDVYVYIDSSGTRTPEKIEKNMPIELISTFDISNSLDALIKNERLPFVLYERKILSKMQQFMLNAHEMPTIEERKTLFGKRELFIEKVNGLFKDTKKSFSDSLDDAQEEDFKFKIADQKYELSHTQLSSGEKQMFYLLLICMLQDNKSCILLMDEPEISLHPDWQKKLLDDMIGLNPNCQFITVTHSPSIFFPKWGDNLKRIEDILINITNKRRTINLKSKEALVTQQLTKISTEGGFIKTKLSKFNIYLNREYFILNATDCSKIISFMISKKITPDAYTYTALINKITEEKDARKILKLMETNLSQKLDNAPYNATLKKIVSFEDRIKFIDMMNAKNIPIDIITFSTLLGKAVTEEEVKIIEDYRNRYGVPTNEIYKNKLRLKS
jgi:predicted ATP-binding protein involved in virulence